MTVLNICYCNSKKIRLDISCESSAWIHMKYQALISAKDKSKKIKVSSAAIFLGAVKVNGELYGE